MGIDLYGCSDEARYAWACNECDEEFDLDHYRDIENHIDAHIHDIYADAPLVPQPPAFPAKCHVCTNLIGEVADHDLSRHPVGEPVVTQYQRKKRRNIKVTNYLRVSDDVVEYTSAFTQEDGNVVISAAWFATLMADGGWKQKSAY